MFARFLKKHIFYLLIWELALADNALSPHPQVTYPLSAPILQHPHFSLCILYIII